MDETDIPDEAVQAALTVAIEADPWGKVDNEAIRAALEAALPHLLQWIGHPVTIHRSYPAPIQVGESDGYSVDGPGQGSVQTRFEWPCDTRIRELEDAMLEVISAQENGPLRQATLHDPNMEQMRRRLRALLFKVDTND